ncbi:MAG: molybdenum cofactor biosynthesis protein MoaE [Coriobacteriia bacterium]|nr:molybdenum cofactor biosynthesis protein MoaE [Coriobacteriia bacterium]
MGPLARRPSLDEWLAEAKRSCDLSATGMFLVHNGVVRGTSRSGEIVSGMDLSVDRKRLDEIVESARMMEGVTYVRAWVNEGALQVGDDIMYVVVAGDIREHVFEALQAIVRMIKSQVVREVEHRA